MPNFCNRFDRCKASIQAPLDTSVEWQVSWVLLLYRSKPAFKVEGPEISAAPAAHACCYLGALLRASCSRWQRLLVLIHVADVMVRIMM